MEPLSSLNEVWMCMAIEYARSPWEVAGRSGERSGRRRGMGSRVRPGTAAAAASTPAPWRTWRRDGTLSSHMTGLGARTRQDDTQVNVGHGQGLLIGCCPSRLVTGSRARHVLGAVPAACHAWNAQITRLTSASREGRRTSQGPVRGTSDPATLGTRPSPDRSQRSRALAADVAACPPGATQDHRPADSSRDLYELLAICFYNPFL